MPIKTPLSFIHSWLFLPPNYGTIIVPLSRLIHSEKSTKNCEKHHCRSSIDKSKRGRYEENAIKYGGVSGIGKIFIALLHVKGFKLSINS